MVVPDAGAHTAEQPREVGEAETWPALRARRRRWTELLRRVLAVEVEVCPRCGGEIKILAFVQEQRAIARILAHLARRNYDARAAPE